MSEYGYSLFDSFLTWHFVAVEGQSLARYGKQGGRSGGATVGESRQRIHEARSAVRRNPKGMYYRFVLILFRLSNSICLNG